MVGAPVSDLVIINPSTPVPEVPSVQRPLLSFSNSSTNSGSNTGILRDSLISPEASPIKNASFVLPDSPLQNPTIKNIQMEHETPPSSPNDVHSSHVRITSLPATPITSPINLNTTIGKETKLVTKVPQPIEQQLPQTQAINSESSLDNSQNLNFLNDEGNVGNIDFSSLDPTLLEQMNEEGSQFDINSFLTDDL